MRSVSHYDRPRLLRWVTFLTLPPLPCCYPKFISGVLHTRTVTVPSPFPPPHDILTPIFSRFPLPPAISPCTLVHHPLYTIFFPHHVFALLVFWRLLILFTQWPSFLFSPHCERVSHFRLLPFPPCCQSPDPLWPDDPVPWSGLPRCKPPINIWTFHVCIFLPP